MNDTKFNNSLAAVYDLLQMYEIQVEDPDVMQNVINCAVAIDNYYHGYNDDGGPLGQ